MPIEFTNGVTCLQPHDTLPDLIGCKRIFLDFETTSGKDGVKSLNPHRDCLICGICITADDIKGAWYIPIGAYYKGAENCDYKKVYPWLRAVLNNADEWVNHNVKYDCHVAINNIGWSLPVDLRLIDTIVTAKIHDSDRLYTKGGYKLSALSKTILKHDISYLEKEVKTYADPTENYGMVPIKIIAPYGGQDSLTCRRLHNFYLSNIPESCMTVLNNEIALTSVLVRLEQKGLCVDPEQLDKQDVKLVARLATHITKIHALTGKYIYPHKNEDCNGLLCGEYNLPVLEWTKGGKDQKPKPSFGKEALIGYKKRPDCPEKLIDVMLDYKRDFIVETLFVTKFRECHINGLVHSDYNQMVQTGRMSCKNPNAQQFNTAAKKLIKPRPGHCFINCDASAQEFRIITHYLENPALVEAYNENPDVDVHQKVADMAGTGRRAAKTLNFASAYGAGKRNILKQLSMNEDVIGNLKDEAERIGGNISETFEYMVLKRAEAVYEEYHRMVPELKTVSDDVAKWVRRRGWAHNLYGRRRHLPRNRAHIGFNTIVQSSAADMAKEGMVKLDAMLRARYPDICILAQIHDSFLIELPIGQLGNEQLFIDFLSILENPSPKQELLVPMRWTFSVHMEDWGTPDLDPDLPSICYRPKPKDPEYAVPYEITRNP